jgi:hypothetical protein
VAHPSPVLLRGLGHRGAKERRRACCGWKRRLVRATLRVGRARAVWKVGTCRVVRDDRARIVEEGGAPRAVDEAVGRQGVARAVEAGAVAVGCCGKSHDSRPQKEAGMENEACRFGGWAVGGGRVVFGNDMVVVP